MLSGEKILVTGPAGQIAFPLAEALARDNEVWGIARFGNPATRDEVKAAGITTRTGDLGSGDLGDLPDDFTYVLHLAALMAPDKDYDEAIRVNAEGTGLLLSHCRKAKAALVMSTQSVYHPHEDPAHVFLETDPLGDAHSLHSPPYSISKIAQEAVARYCARTLDLPVIIARMNSSYSARGGLPTQHLSAVMAGNAVTTRWDPCYYSPIHQDDINAQAAALLDAAAVPAPIVNWAGDEPVTVQEWVAYFGELTGSTPTLNVTPIDGTSRGSIASSEKRSSFTGPCTVTWKDGLRRVYEELTA